MQYIPHNQCVLSCAGSSSYSLLLRDVERKRKAYNFRIRKVESSPLYKLVVHQPSPAVLPPQGVICFDYSHPLELLVSGGVDHLVRLWNPYVPSRPMALLAGHTTAVLDVLIHREAGLLFSFSQDLVILGVYM